MIDKCSNEHESQHLVIKMNVNKTAINSKEGRHYKGQTPKKLIKQILFISSSFNLDGEKFAITQFTK
jgi:hypothetical protein